MRRDGRLFTLTFPPEPDESVLAAYVEWCDAFYARDHETLAWVIDGTEVRLAHARLRKYLIDNLNAHREHMKQHCTGVAVVVTNAFIRGAAQAILWMAPPEYPHKFFGRLADAEAWARASLEQKPPANESAG
ncbi:MAG: hypothetical protein AAF658_10140 [Myxococcota bacterium]